MFKTNFSGEKLNEILLYKWGLKQNFTIEKTVRNEISKFLNFHSFLSSSSFENSCDDGKWPLGGFNATQCAKHVRYTG